MAVNYHGVCCITLAPGGQNLNLVTSSCRDKYSQIKEYLTFINEQLE